MAKHHSQKSKHSLTFNMPPVQQLTFKRLKGKNISNLGFVPVLKATSKTSGFMPAGQSPLTFCKPTLQCTPGHDSHQIPPSQCYLEQTKHSTAPSRLFELRVAAPAVKPAKQAPSAVATQTIRASGCRETALLWEPLIPLCCVPQLSGLLNNTLSCSVHSPQTLTWSSRFPGTPVNAGMARSFPFLFTIRSHTVVS